MTLLYQCSILKSKMGTLYLWSMVHKMIGIVA
uniref:Uncharacterized protein n=1 Tax=Arundo donax TaxID=35708 RepID=A0A0A9EQH9_ARUDO